MGSLVSQLVSMSVEPTSIIYGNQNGNKTFACCVIDTKYGLLPGKAKGKTAWYTWSGIEFEEKDSEKFEIITGRILKGAEEIPRHLPGGKSCNHKTYCAMAQTQWGLIPGRASIKDDRYGMDKTCWFPYNGKEHCTSEFYFVETDALTKWDVTTYRKSSINWCFCC